ncbi:hypothetical protein [Streptomyces halobius]|uniref:Uncharacterized protein n=1 Tax=Streptomyces halobius TaxID=2879846 RepID=A0ABY4M8E3_9ACTN|nr:hypothetical protein [Streptomyces halobius]UQA92641.1 hypothetical protein K9S39_13110 [Streptomyces halobius]
MGEESESDTKKSDTKKKEKRIDLSLAQVAGSALAAAVAAYLAGQFSLYGTIIGAGVVSVVATTGGSIFQHLFRRTGEQLKEATVTTRPKPRRVPRRRSDPDDSHSRSTPRDARRADPTMVLPTFEEQGAPDTITSVADRNPGPGTDRTQPIPRGGLPGDARPTDKTQLVPRLDEATMALRQEAPRPAGRTSADHGTADVEEVNSTTYGTRLRGWKRSALGALAVFVLAMGAVTATELITDRTPSGGKGTTLGRLITGGGSGRHQPGTPQTPDPGHSTGNGTSGGTREPSTDPGDPGRTGSDPGRGTPSPTPTPSGGGETSPDPETSPSGAPSPSRSGTGDDSGDGSNGGQDKGTGAQQEQENSESQQSPDPHAS